MKGMKNAKNDLRPRSQQWAAVAQDGVVRRTLSFYRYLHIKDPAAFRERLLAKWTEYGCLGRIYVAKEGINAQLNVPVVNWDKFDAWNKSQPELQGVPYKIAVEEAAALSFYKLIIKVRDKIVSDGLDDESFDVTNTGAYLTAREINAYVDDPEAVIIDMRNAYESEVGHFDGAITPDVNTFREELAIVPEKYNVYKNKKVALYCTGGIRCEKASAWLKHNGFTDVRHLKGGIIDYAHQVKREGLPNRFNGKNFVFDDRLGERISDEVISSCHLCQSVKSDTHYDCRFRSCHGLFLACEPCATKMSGYCSFGCLTLDTLPLSLKKRYARYRASKRQEFSKGRRVR